jgi:hypothetical protein
MNAFRLRPTLLFEQIHTEDPKRSNDVHGSLAI